MKLCEDLGGGGVIQYFLLDTIVVYRLDFVLYIIGGGVCSFMEKIKDE